MDAETISDVALKALREHLRQNVRAEFEKVANEVIDAAVDAACAEFETRLVAQRDMAMDRLSIRYSVERIKK
ncbi:MAG: hypothetical protein ACXW3X_14615 [Rhodoplanes sp.]